MKNWKWALCALSLPMLLNCGVMTQGKGDSPSGSSSQGTQRPPTGSPGGGSSGTPIDQNPPPPANEPTNNPAFLGMPATNYASQNGVMVDPGGYVSNLDNGDWIRFDNIDFETKAIRIYMEMALDSTGEGGTVQVVLDSETGPVIGELPVAITGGWEKFTFQSTYIEDVTGVHSVYFKFKGGAGIGNIKSWNLAK